MSRAATSLNNGRQVLAHEDLPLKFTLRDFHHIAQQLYGYMPCTSKRIITMLKQSGEIEVYQSRQPYKTNALTVYQERRTAAR